MSDYTRRFEADELREKLSECHDYIAKLEAECKELKEKLHEAELAVEHNRNVADEEQHKGELRYRDGVIYGLKYALICNGVSGGEVQ
jgi:predicted RNase H-like nuclease (RuvC/YqgF family)